MAREWTYPQVMSLVPRRPRDPNSLAQYTPVTRTFHKPGDALETHADQHANELVRLEAPIETRVPQQPTATVDCTSPAANLASRVNIVPSGPGSVADFVRD